MRFNGNPILVLLLLAAGCDRAPQVHELRGETMGTSYAVTLVSPPDSLVLPQLSAAIDRSLDAIVMLASTYEPDSEISRFNASPSTDWIEVTAEFCSLVDSALEISARTGGAFDVTVGPIVDLWGFGPGDMHFEPPEKTEIDAALERVGYERLETRCAVPAMRKRPAGVMIDLSGWAKGHAVDRLAAILDGHDVDNYLVEIGGELRARGRNASGELWGVAIERPLPSAREVQRILRLGDAAIATSGDYRNFFTHEGTRYSHIVDARTGYPVAHELAAVTVIADTTAEADAMATALLVLGPDEGMRLAESLGVAGYFLVRDGDSIEARASSGFAKRMNL